MRLRFLVAALALVLVPVFPAAAQSRWPDPVTSPPGANDWACEPSERRPLPVILVHGTMGNAHDDWFALSPVLKRAGYCVYALDYGDTGRHPLDGAGPVEKSAQELAAFVEEVLAATSAEKVLMVGYSQGGTLPRYYMRFLGGRDKVKGLVSLAPTGHGSTSPIWKALPVLQPHCVACGQQNADSPLLAALNAGGDTEDGVAYTVLASATDGIITPWRRQFLDGAVNLKLQDLCAVDLSEHVMLPVSPVSARVVLDALANGGRADPRIRPGCGGVFGKAHRAAIVKRLTTVGAIVLYQA